MIQPTVTERGERSRQAILDAAGPIFAERGYAGASLNAIIRASGLTKGGFYFHFPSKQALALAVIQDGQERWIQGAYEIALRSPRAVDRVFAVPRALLAVGSDARGGIAQRRLIDELSTDPTLRDSLRRVMREQVKRTADLFREAQRAGEIRPDVDVDLVAEVAVGGFQGMQCLTDQLGDDELERRVEALITVVQLATLSRTD